ncbi:MAG: N-6 DNA methylase [Gammaproteobacteria bacterium]|nr:N-6 DNA methylase [Gammaproteobacteria bacterium]
MPNLTPKQIAAGKWLLKQSAGYPEDFIRKRIGDLLGSLDIDYEISYPTESGPADIYLPRRRTVIETKALGLADDPDKPQSRKNKESPKEQLERYLRAEISRELKSAPPDGGESRPWTGILTDGRIWHVWRYAHEENAVGVTVEAAYSPPAPSALIDRLKHILSGKLVGKPWIPADPRPIFEPRLEQLRKLYESLPKRAERATETKRRLWLEMLRTSSMEPDSEAARQRLFVAHSFLVALARGVIHALANPGEEPNTETVLGDGFVAWIVETVKGKQWAKSFLGEIQGYDWRRRPGDVLRPLYEQFVDERDRKAFGEFYTPDWLAELLVREVCDDSWCETAVTKALAARHQSADLEGAGVLDPTCGSGTFLYHAAKRILASPALADLANSDKASIVCSLVHGIDVHPVAAEIARATLLRALPTEPPHGESDLRVHEGDALLIHADDENSLFRPTNGEIRISTPRGAEVLLPRSFVERSDFSDNLRRLVLSAEDGRSVPPDILAVVPSSDRDAMRECHQRFVEIIKDEGDSVWTWYIRNTTGPHRLSEKKIDRIVANPPWVKMAHVQAQGRKRAIEKFAASLNINLWAGGKYAPHFDIAQLFIKRTRQLYLADPQSDPAAWLVKKAALKSGNWEKFRQWHSTVCKQTIDLEALKPFGGGDARRCCALFDARASSLKSRQKQLMGLIKGELPSPHASLDDIRERLTFKAVLPPVPCAASEYIDGKGNILFSQGATITPKVLVVLDKVDKSDNRKQCRVTTKCSSHPPWSGVDPQTGIVPRGWIRGVIASTIALPFAVSPAGVHQALIPTNKNRSLDKSAAKNSAFWESLNEIYEENKGAGTHTPGSLISRIDYGSTLSVQLNLSGRSKAMVVYPSSGDIMRACRIQPGRAIVDASLYYFVASSASEAAYLVALMNAPCLADAFAQSRESGRDFHLHPWRKIPICRYDGRISAHVELAKLAVQAERMVEKWLHSPYNPSDRLGQVGLSQRLRDFLRAEGVFARIDRLARKILPDQARRD